MCVLETEQKLCLGEWFLVLNPVVTLLLTPSLPVPVKVLGLKVHARMPPDSIFDGPITNLLSVLSILIKVLFIYSCEGVKKLQLFKFNVFQIWHIYDLIIGNFPSDGMACMEVKGLILITVNILIVITLTWISFSFRSSLAFFLFLTA